MMEIVVTTAGMKTCKAPVRSSPPTNQHRAVWRPDDLFVTQPTVWEHWRERRWQG